MISFILWYIPKFNIGYYPVNEMISEAFFNKLMQEVGSNRKLFMKGQVTILVLYYHNSYNLIMISQMMPYSSHNMLDRIFSLIRASLNVHV